MIAGLVSTIIPVYNRADLVRQATASVLAQTYRPVEIVIVDDGSADETPRVCDELAEGHPEIRTTRIPNSGPGLAREKGRQLAQGEFIQYLDSDDLLRPLKFERQILALRAAPQAGVAYCRTMEYEIGRVPGEQPSAHTGEGISHLFPSLLSGRRWQTVSPLFRRSVTDAVGPWSDLRQEEDWEYDARVAALGTELVWCNEYLADLRHHVGPRAGGNSVGDPAKMRWRFEAHKRIYGHALSAGVARRDAHMQHFARALFLLARQCGASGLNTESRELFDLAWGASDPTLTRTWDLRIYGYLARVVGWVAAGRLACWSDRLRPTGAS